MRKYLSVFGLAARSSLWKALAVTGLTAILAGLMLYFLPRQELQPYTDQWGETEVIVGSYTFSEAVKNSCAAIALAVGFVILCAVLAGVGWGKGAKTGYTARRLRVQKNTVCLLWTAYYFMVLLLYWAVSAGVMLLALALRVKNATGGELDSLSMVLACYNAPLLHHLLPVGDAFAWCGNILGLLACAVGCADVAQKKWRGQTGGIALAIAVALTVGGCFISLQNSSNQMLLLWVEGAMVGIVAYGWWGGDKSEETEPDVRRP